MAEKKAGSSDSDLAAEILKEFGRVSGDRGTWEIHWEEIAARVWPSNSKLFNTTSSPGEKKTLELIDSTAAQALNKFGAIMDSLLTPRNQTWHRLMPSDRKLLKSRRVRLWFEELNISLFKYRYAPKANFSSQNQLNWKSLGAFGTGCMFTDELKGGPGEVGVRYKNIHLGGIYFLENHQGIVDTAFRKFTLTARQAVQKWGQGNLPSQITSALESTPDREFEFIHKVCPRSDQDSDRLDYRGMPFCSYYVSRQGQALVEEGGYTSFPYAISRYEQSPNEVYGRSPAMDVLPAIKTLNEQKRTVLIQGQRATAPILLAHDDGVVDQFNWKPGSINPGGVAADGRPLIHALPVGNLAVGKDLMDDERALINDAFLVSLFQILVESPQMTATEVMERAREKGILLAPTTGRQQSEYLGPLIEREIDLHGRLGLIPPMPQELKEAKGEYRIEYDSPLSRAQRAEEASGLMRTVEMALNYVNITQDPSPLDWLDMDESMPELADIQGVPARWIRSLERVQAIREGRQKNVEIQQGIQAAPGTAAMVKAVATTQKGKA